MFNSSTWNFLKQLIIKNKNSLVGLIFIDCLVPVSIGEVIRSATKLQHLQLNNITVKKFVQGMILTENGNYFTCSIAFVIVKYLLNLCATEENF